MSIKRDLKTLSKQGWSTENATNDDLQTSCLMRIADALEPLAQNHLQMLQQIEKHKRDAGQYYKWFQDERAETERLKRSIVAHKSNYTRLKNKLEAMKNDVIKQ